MALQTPAIELGDVQETLLIPLYLRAMESRRPDAIIRDPTASRIVESISYDFTRFGQPWHIQMEVAVRTEILDQQVGRFINRHPDGIVVNLGAGLDGRFFRLDNGRINWYELDMPDAIDLRRQYFPPAERNRLLPKSMFDWEWIDGIEASSEQPVMLVAEGLFCYFDEDSIRELFQNIADRLPGAEILFQSISPRYVGKHSRVPAVNATRAALKWGIASGRELEAWDPRYEFLDEWTFIDRHRGRWRWMRYASWLPPVRRLLREVWKITHLRFRHNGERFKTGISA